MNRRQQAEAQGRAAEDSAAAHLEDQGWIILARRHRGQRGSGAGELDLIARTDSTLAFVEVKRRPSPEQALLSLTARQRRRIETAAEAFLAGHPELAGLDIRFDLITLAPAAPPHHLADAWRVGD
ncbi:putative endonuclease [Roseospirillum parvum]|uniref:UPF0102 protein SAMN05421742_10443 n=2 Tax=Roseospirillum parvum TaxID=83401 RepID=A0A1G7Z9F9_9PROT|nr:YraN family protein [Roseospirillum parvum]SDH05338.1 putative endonuclease [Roseospirillum parvum]